MDVLPESIARDGESAILIRWTDGMTTKLTAVQLRDACPCATCREKHRGSEDAPGAASLSLPVLSAAEAKPLSITSMRPVGSYAYNIAFSDGHSSGLYLMESLRELGSAGG